MTKPRGPLPQLTEHQQYWLRETHPSRVSALLARRRELLLGLAAAGWSHRMLAELYGVTHNTIRYWMRERRDPK